jgi:hypothetical protein
MFAIASTQGRERVESWFRRWRRGSSGFDVNNARAWIDESFGPAPHPTYHQQNCQQHEQVKNAYRHEHGVIVNEFTQMTQE